MRKCVFLAAMMAASIPSLLAAQTPAKTTQTKPKPPSPYPDPPKWFVHLHGGGQPGSQDLNTAADFDLYDERAHFETSINADGGGFLDIGGEVRLYKNYGAGISYAGFSSAAAANYSGSLPHPEVFDRPRAFSGSETVEHKEHGVHLQAVWFIPYTDKIDFTVGIGPSFFSAEQGFVRGVGFSENPPDFNTVTIDSVDVVTAKESAVGINFGATGTYAITSRIGASVMLRYAHGSVTFRLGDGQTVDADTGGFQLGAGIAVRFSKWPWTKFWE
jgi:hypothetical protein